MENSLCATRLPSLPSYISHLRLVHATDPNFSIKCGINNCLSNFKSFRGFNSHVYCHHHDALDLVTKSINTVNSGSAANLSHSNITDLSLSPHEDYDCSPVENDMPEPPPLVYMWHLLGATKENSSFIFAQAVLSMSCIRKEYW